SSGPAVRHPADPTGGRGCPLASGRAAAPARRSQHRPGTVSAQRQAAGAALATVSVVTVRPNLGRNDLRGGEEHVQISSRFGGGVFASSALAASVVLGGAGVANAQGSLDSLTGSLSPSDVEVTVAGGEDGVAGEVANNTDVPLADCTVHYSDADSMELVEAAL